MRATYFGYSLNDGKSHWQNGALGSFALALMKLGGGKTAFSYILILPIISLGWWDDLVKNT